MISSQKSSFEMMTCKWLNCCGRMIKSTSLIIFPPVSYEMRVLTASKTPLNSRWLVVGVSQTVFHHGVFVCTFCNIVALLLQTMGNIIAATFFFRFKKLCLLPAIFVQELFFQKLVWCQSCSHDTQWARVNRCNQFSSQA